MSELKNRLHRELAVKNACQVEGIDADPSIFAGIGLGGEYQEQILTLFDYNLHNHTGVVLPMCFYTPGGLRIGYRWHKQSPYKLRRDGDQFVLVHEGTELFPLTLKKRPGYYSRQTSDGSNMNQVATHNGEGAIFVSYSNECFLKETGHDCKYCNINYTHDHYGDEHGVSWKYPHQIGETAAAAYKEGSKHITISGGFIPERREIDYYFDVAEAIQEHTGLQDFNGTAVIGAPLDLGIIEQYKEVGYRTIAMNIEIWDKHIFNSVCPGKVIHCGGWEHWVKALERAAVVFGHGRVRSNIVGGIEPKKSLLEGISYLASQGVIAYAGSWIPNLGSEYEGHRSPVPEWHLDVAYKIVDIFRNAGFTYEQLYDCSASADGLWHDIYKIEEERLPVFRSESAAV